MTTMTTNDTTAKDRIVSRRRVLAMSASAVGLTVGSAAVLSTPERASALEIGAFQIDNVEETLEGSPTALPTSATVDVTGETTRELAQIAVSLDARFNGRTETIDSDAVFEVDGAFDKTLSFAGDLLEHPEVSAENLNPPTGENASIEPKLIVNAEAIFDGNTVASETVQQTVNVTVVGGDSTTLNIAVQGAIQIDG